MSDTITTSAFLELLATEIEQRGGQSAYARLTGIPQPHISDILLGKRQPYRSIAERLGYARVEQAPLWKKLPSSD